MSFRNSVCLLVNLNLSISISYFNFIVLLILIFQNSVICDLTNKNRVQSSYLRALHHYQAWHFSGSDLMYEIGPHRKRFCASRKDQTFIFWFRYLVQDVGLVIDGQALWAEGMLRRTRGTDGSYTYASPIQFRNAPKDVSSSSSKQKAPMETPYIVCWRQIMVAHMQAGFPT